MIPNMARKIRFSGTRKSVYQLFAGCVYQLKSKYRQGKIMKHASTGTNYEILTKRVKVKHKKKFVSNLKSMQIVDFEQTKFMEIEIFVP